jgi:hypothetical protein
MSITSISRKNDASPFWECNFLDSDTLELFYLSKEAVFAYAKNQGTVNRRNIALQVGEILNAFLGREFSEAETKFIESIIKRDASVLSQTKDSDADLLPKLKLMDPQGFALLEIQTDIDLKSLKQLYKRAARKHHPDLGGSKIYMQKVNEAYSVFFETINNVGFDLDIDANSHRIVNLPQCVDDWLYSIHLVLSCINGDFFAADRAFEHLKQAESYSRRSSSPYIGEFTGHFLYTSIYRASGALARFGMEHELKVAARITSGLVDRYIADWQPQSKSDLKPSRENYATEAALLSELGTKITITHLEQAKNAYRMEKIDQSRFDTTVQRLAQRNNDDFEMVRKINGFINEHGFVPRISDYALARRDFNPKVIPFPQFNQDRFEFLWEEQKWEYLRAFGERNSGHLFAKYYVVRTQEILLGLIKHYDQGVVQKWKTEARFFIDNFENTFARYKLLIEIIEHIAALSDSERTEKLGLLTEIDDMEQRSMDVMMSFNFSDVANRIYKKRIQLDEDYVEFSKLNFDYLNLYRATGELRSEFQISWKTDMNRLHSFEKTPIAIARKKVWLSEHKPTPENVVETSEPYLVELLRIGKQFHPKNTGQLQIGFEIGRITTAYAKLSNWSKVRYWSDLFFGLDEHYRSRSSLGEQETIKKRLERARRYLG